MAHDLTDDDLRRFVNCDVFYDPKPLLGFIPQWLWSLLGIASIGCVFSVQFTHSLVLAGMFAATFAVIVLGILIMLCKSRRTIARLSDLCDHRTLTITPDGLTVTIPKARPTSTDLATVGPVAFPWNDIAKIELSEGYLIFWLNGRLRVVLPWRALPSSAEAEAFLESASRWHSDAH